MSSSSSALIWHVASVDKLGLPMLPKIKFTLNSVGFKILISYFKLETLPISAQVI